jgi:hypothetical protein
MALPRDVVREDRRLDKEASKAGAALMELRWRWTLDESNPKRVGFSEYARTVGKSEVTIRADAKGFVLRSTNPEITPTEARERSKMSVETEAVIEAVASARDLGVQQVSKTRRSEVSRVREIARERAEEKGTSIEEEAPTVADFIAKADKATAKAHADRSKRVNLRLIEAEGMAHKMIREGVKLLSLIREIDWDAEAVEELEETIGKLRALVGLIDVALVGAADIDWDGELARLTKEK